jgi:hypothetical protein
MGTLSIVSSPILFSSLVVLFTGNLVFFPSINSTRGTRFLSDLFRVRPVPSSFFPGNEEYGFLPPSRGRSSRFLENPQIECIEKLEIL